MAAGLALLLLWPHLPNLAASALPNCAHSAGARPSNNPDLATTRQAVRDTAPVRRGGSLKPDGSESRTRNVQTRPVRRPGDAGDTSFQARVGALLDDKHLTANLPGHRSDRRAGRAAGRLARRADDPPRVLQDHGLSGHRHRSPPSREGHRLRRDPRSRRAQALSQAPQRHLQGPIWKTTRSTRRSPCSWLISARWFPCRRTRRPRSRSRPRPWRCGMQPRGNLEGDFGASQPQDSEPADPTPEQERSSPAAELAQEGKNQAQGAGTPATSIAAAGENPGSRPASR